MTKKPKIFALIVAGGVGARAGEGIPKQYRLIGGKPMISYSIEAFSSHPAIAGVQLVIGEGHEKYFNPIPNPQSLIPVTGGTIRAESVRAGLEALKPHAPDYVLIHDAARPFISHAVIDRVLEALNPHTGVAPALSVADTVRRLAGDNWQEISRDGLLRIQTPQAFPYKKLYNLFNQPLAPSPQTPTDDAALWLAAGHTLQYVAGDERLRKVTTADDITWAEREAAGMRRIAVGSGYDVHRFAVGNAVILGGVRIPHTHRLEGHSDADAVLHALVDAILGALGEGDIGQHFPPSDPKWKGADSRLFVAEAIRRATARGAAIQHVDITVIAEAPKIGPHREAMQRKLAEMLGIPVAYVGIKATTTEGLGFTGRSEGLAASATVTLSLPL